jgi:Tfp pilus assembly protein PilF
MDMYSQAVEVYPAGEKHEVYFQMAELEFFKRGNLDAAKDYLTKSFADGDLTWNSHFLMGQILEQQGDLEGAKKEYGAAAVFNPENTDVQDALKRVSA